MSRSKASSLRFLFIFGLLLCIGFSQVQAQEEEEDFNDATASGPEVDTEGPIVREIEGDINDEETAEPSIEASIPAEEEVDEDLFVVDDALASDEGIAGGDLDDLEEEAMGSAIGPSAGPSDKSGALQAATSALLLLATPIVITFFA